MDSSTYTDYAHIYAASGQAWVGLRAWSTLERWLASVGWRGMTAVDLGCGTGEIVRALRYSSYAVTGVDRSAAMLALARAANPDAGIVWQHTNFIDWHSDVPVDLIVSFYDTLNYLTDAAQLNSVFDHVAAALRPDGIFAFDLNTIHEYTTWDERATVTADDESLFVYNVLHFDPATQLAQGRIVWFEQTAAGWQRGEELHIQRAYADDEIVAALDHAGLTLQARLDLVGTPADLARATRILYITQRQSSARS